MNGTTRPGGAAPAPQQPSDLYPELAAYVRLAQAELASIPLARRAELELLARFIRERRAAGEPARLVFICTHNSRRSHLAQIWAQAAAHVYGVAGIETYSGGTEATAFNPRAVAALGRAGFRIEATDGGDNPRYVVRFSDRAAPMECFSKVYDQPPNPRTGFCAVMTCAAADEACPVVLGAARRLALRYDDPKAFDGTARERQMYDQRCRQIARELFYCLLVVRRTRAEAERAG